MSPKTGTDRASPSDAVWMSDPWRLLSGCHGCRNQPCGRAGRGDGQLPAWAVALALAFYAGRHLPATVWGHRPAAIRRQEPRKKASSKTETRGERQGWDAARPGHVWGRPEPLPGLAPKGASLGRREMRLFIQRGEGSSGLRPPDSEPRQQGGGWGRAGQGLQEEAAEVPDSVRGATSRPPAPCGTGRQSSPGWATQRPLLLKAPKNTRVPPPFQAAERPGPSLCDSRTRKAVLRAAAAATADQSPLSGRRDRQVSVMFRI